MVITALAAQAKPSSADIHRRFLTTSRAYLGLLADNRPIPAIGSEFIDPPRYRKYFEMPAMRAIA